MNLKTERIENHRAQLTIEIESEQLEDAKRIAARKISRQVRIKGFRKGKAPYRLVAQAVGEGAILEEAVETLGDSLYKEALQESEVVPYGPGAFDDFKLEPAPTFVFSVPLQPEVDLNEYLEVRVDFEEPEVNESDIDQALKQMQLRALEVIDDSVAVAAAGNRVTIAVNSEFVDGDSPDEIDTDEAAPEIDDALSSSTDPEDDDEGEPETAAEPAPYVPKKGDTFVTDENAVIILDPNEDPFTHGFVEHLIGVELGSDVEFELTIPDDDADPTIVNRQVIFWVTLKKIEAISIPKLDDEFARQVSRNRGDAELDLAGLRAATREDLERSALAETKTNFSSKVLQEIVEGAEIDFPEMMLEEHIDDLIGDFERNLAQQRIKLDDYYRLTSSSEEDLREQHRDRALHSLRQSLVLREIVSEQKIEVSDEDLETRMDVVVAGYGASPELRKLFDTPQMRGNLRNELVMSLLNDTLVAIGRGEDPADAIEALRESQRADAKRAHERSERMRSYQSELEEAAQPDSAANEDDLEDSAVENSAPVEDSASS